MQLKPEQRVIVKGTCYRGGDTIPKGLEAEALKQLDLQKKQVSKPKAAVKPQAKKEGA